MMKRDLPELLAAMNARIDQLQAENEEKDKEIIKLKDANISQRRGLRQLRDELSRVEAERAAAVADLELTPNCRTCGKNRGFGRCDSKGGTCKYQWRGAQEEG